MCRRLYVTQLKTLVTVTSLDAWCLLARFYFYRVPSLINVSPNTIDYTIATRGFILDCVGSIIPISSLAFMGCLALLNCGRSDTEIKNSFRRIGLQVMRRILTMRCNCPCYRTRPKLRFIVRVFFLVLCMVFRMIAAILYSKANFQALMILCAACEVFLIVPLAFDIYHYRVWWHYRPGNDNLYTSYSKRHRRYLPHHLLGENRDTMTLGNAPCKQLICQNRKLEHILIYHHSEYQPQKRWPEIREETNTYVGFHRTSAENAVRIAHSDIRPSTESPQMLGSGIYFARSIKHTEGKARQGRTGGGIICAKIRMGRVKIVNRTNIGSVQNTAAWHADFDTVYYTHNDERRDEFCVKSPDQILKWVMVIEEQCDPKVRDYGMDTEFSDTRCGCI